MGPGPSPASMVEADPDDHSRESRPLSSIGTVRTGLPRPDRTIIVVPNADCPPRRRRASVGLLPLLSVEEDPDE